jgi:hypothetical protein
MRGFASGRADRRVTLPRLVGFSSGAHRGLVSTGGAPRDDLQQQRWGWVIEDHYFCVRAAIVPGISGAVVADDSESLEVRIPIEFVAWCSALRLSLVA